jgi:hypothetical protein
VAAQCHRVDTGLTAGRGNGRGGHEPGAASSKAKNGPMGRQPLKSGGEPPEEASAPRARRGVARGVPRPVSWWAIAISLGRGPFHFGPRPHGACFLGSVARSFVFYYFSKKGFPRLLGDPYGCPRHLQHYTSVSNYVLKIGIIIKVLAL